MTYVVLQDNLRDFLDETIEQKDLDKQISDQLDPESHFFHIRLKKLDIGIYFPRKIVRAIDIVPYNSRTWNNFPESLPPNKKWMEVLFSNKKKGFAFFDYSQAEWVDVDGNYVGSLFDDDFSVTKFRCWKSKKK